MRRVAVTLWVLGGGILLSLLTATVNTLWLRHDLARVWDEGGFEGWEARLRTYFTVSEVTSWSIAALILGGALVLVVARRGRRGRTHAVSAAVAGGLHLAINLLLTLLVYGESATITLSEALEATLILLQAAALVIAMGLVLAATIRCTAAPRAYRQGLLVFAVAGGIHLAVLLVGLAAPSLAPELLPWVSLALSFGVGLTFATMAGFLGGVAARRGEDDGEPADVDETSTAGSALRLLGWALLLRAGVAVAGMVTLVVVARNEDYALAQQAVVAFAVFGLVPASLLLVALARYGDLGEGSVARGPLELAGALVLLGLIAELVVAYAAHQLFGAVAQMQSASSFWDMPSLSTLETYQGLVTWLGRFALLAGIVASLAILSSLRDTARWIEQDDLLASATRVTALVSVAGFGLFVVRTAVEEGMRIDAIALLLAAVGLLLVGVYAFVEWMVLTFGLARALDSRTTRAVGGED